MPDPLPPAIDRAKAYDKANADREAARVALAADIRDGCARIIWTNAGPVVFAKVDGNACEDMNPEILDVRTAHT
jgi:hypothetical protein